MWWRVSRRTCSVGPSRNRTGRIIGSCSRSNGLRDSSRRRSRVVFASPRDRPGRRPAARASESSSGICTGRRLAPGRRNAGSRGARRPFQRRSSAPRPDRLDRRARAPWFVGAPGSTGRETRRLPASTRAGQARLPPAVESSRRAVLRSLRAWTRRDRCSGVSRPTRSARPSSRGFLLTHATPASLRTGALVAAHVSMLVRPPEGAYATIGQRSRGRLADRAAARRTAPRLDVRSCRLRRDELAGLLDRLRKRRDRGRVEDRVQRDVGVFSPDPDHDLRREQRVAAEREEVVVHADRATPRSSSQISTRLSSSGVLGARYSVSAPASPGSGRRRDRSSRWGSAESSRGARSGRGSCTRAVRLAGTTGSPSTTDVPRRRGSRRGPGLVRRLRVRPPPLRGSRDVGEAPLRSLPARCGSHGFSAGRRFAR